LQAGLIMPDGATSSSFPTGCWSAAQPAGLAPRFLSVGQAAAYVGVSADTFLEEVALGWWPAALRRGAKGRRLTWGTAWRSTRPPIGAPAWPPRPKPIRSG
jgi:hypothetical protein